MPTTVLVDDLVSGRRWNYYCSEATQGLVEAQWEKPDVLLVELSETTLFKGLTTWSQLRPIHFKVLITRNFFHLDQLTTEEVADDDQPAVTSLHFLIGCMVKSLGIHADIDVDLLKVRRVGEESVHFDYTGSLFLELAGVPTQGGLKVVVDNTK